MDTHTSLDCLPPDRDAEPNDFRKRGKWLVVDDEPMTRTVIALALKEMAQIDVIECNSGELAWDVWRSLPGIEGVITDLHMPGMNGLELAERVHAHKPEAPIILVTACTEDLVGEELRELGVRQVVAKPFSCDELLSALRDTLRTTNWLAAA